MARRELHSYATQRTHPRGGSGMASVDIHAWLLTLALAFLLRNDLHADFPLQLNWPSRPQAISNMDAVQSSGEFNAIDCMISWDEPLLAGRKTGLK